MQQQKKRPKVIPWAIPLLPHILPHVPSLCTEFESEIPKKISKNEIVCEGCFKDLDHCSLCYFEKARRFLNRGNELLEDTNIKR